MPTDTQSPNSQSQATQNYSQNIQKMYADYVTGGATPGSNDAGSNIGIDDFRAQLSVTITGQTTSDLINTLGISPTSTTPATTPNTSTPTIIAQESRCHAFYRIIGFPVVSADGSSFYNPGFDSVMQNVTRNVPLSKKISIATTVGKAFETLSQTREQYAANTAQVFNNPLSVEAGVLALMSGTYGKNGFPNLRPFPSPFTKITGPFDASPSDQIYPSDIHNMVSLVGPIEIPLALYQWNPSTSPNTGFPNLQITNPSVFSQHQHIILPFAVDPRIDFSIWTTRSTTSNNLSKRIAVPFVPDASFLKTSSTTTAQPPLIEKIIKERFSQFNDASTTGVANQSVIDFINSFSTVSTPTIGDVTISQIASGGIFGASQQSQFANYLNIIKSMMKTLVDAMNIIHSAQAQYYWLPQPSIQGPEGGSTVRNVTLDPNLPSTLITIPGDLDVIVQQAKVTLTSINASIAQSNATPDAGGYTAAPGKLSFDSSTSNSQGNLSSNTMNTISNKRSKVLGDANQALQTVEMIMGEFSGLGLADITAIVGALYVIPQNNLLGFLDDDAIVRAEAILGPLPARPSLTDAMTSFASTVNLFYLVMSQLFQDSLVSGGLQMT
jgi:hypothetical protein